MSTITDVRGKTFRTARMPERIVSLVPSITELLGSLDLAQETTGLTRFCTHPAGWKDSKTIVGGTKSVNVERVRQLEPDLVLANKEENTKPIVQELDGFARVHVSLVGDLPAALRMIRDIGTLTHRASKADDLAAEIALRFDSAVDVEPIRAAYFIWKDPWMTVGGDTFINDMMRRGGFENVFADTTRYPTTTLDEVREREPDVLMLSSEPYPFDESHRNDLEDQLPAIRATCVRGDLFSWYGSRLLRTPDYLQKLYLKLRQPGTNLP